MNVAFGRCIPDSCSEQDLSASMSYFMQKLTGFDTTLYVSSCHSQDEEIPYTAGEWSFISVCVLFGILIFTGTMIDISIKYLKAGFFNKRLVQIFQGFSFYRNTLKIFATDVRKDSLTSINGIRFLSMTWVLFGHAFGAFTNQIPTTNGMVMYDKDGPIWGSLAFQAMEQAYPSVDTFFMIGACVLTYSTLKQLDKQKGGNFKFWIMFYVHRYLRLTAVYAMVIFFTATLWKHFATGPQSTYVDYDVSSCQKSWWINLLYVNNFQLQWHEYSSHYCIGQGWYLANDMQFFIISPIFIVALWYNKLIGMVVCAAGVIVSTVVPTWLAYANDYPISFSYMGANFHFLIHFYVVPWCRFQPYIVGIILGYVLHRMRDQPKLKLNPYFSIWIWGIAGAIGASVIYGLYPYADDYVDIGILDPTYEVAPRTLSAFYNGFHRLAWSVCVAWVVLACTKGAGGTINSILSWPCWIPLANLSYCIYLVHLSVINYMASLFTFSVTYTHILGVYFVLGILCFSIFVAFIFAVIFELPIAHLERLAFASIGIGSYPEVKKD